MANANATPETENNWTTSALNQSHDAMATLCAIEALILAAPTYETDANVMNARTVMRSLKEQLENVITILDVGSVSSTAPRAFQLPESESAAICRRLERVYHSTRAIHQLSLDAIDRSNVDLCASYLGAISEMALCNAGGLAACVQKISKTTQLAECASELDYLSCR